LVCASLIKLRKNQPTTNTYFKIPYGNHFAIAGILLTIWLLSGTQSEEIIDTFIWTGAGLVIFMIHSLTKKKF